ncbi:MAG TPA: hypothetical protein VGO60_12920 [Iamia sp.]|nr:hypothetical protein [Iamia sp.]
MIEAGFWGFVGGFALLIGAALGLWLPISTRVIGMIMAFGSGVLVSALAFDLTDEAFRRGGTASVALGLAGGAVAFFVGDVIVSRRGGGDRKRSGGQQEEGSGSAIVVGALLDGVPESVAIGVTLLDGGGVGVAVVAAVFLSNVPESLSAATGLRKAGRSTGWIMTLWLGVAALTAVSAAAGYGLLGDASPTLIGVIQAFAAGAILAMLASTMLPEAFEDTGPEVGLITVAGFALAFLLSTTG